MSNQQTVDKEMEEWGSRWQVGSKYRLDDNRADSDAFDSLPLAVLPTPTPEQIIAACLTFPAGTGLGADNISPRAIARLPHDHLLLLLARILTAAEAKG